MFTLTTNTGAFLPLPKLSFAAAVAKAESLASRLNTRIIVSQGSRPVVVSLPR